MTFDWTAGRQDRIAYWMDIGNMAAGTTTYSSGNLGNVLTTTASGSPTDGSTLYVTLYTLIGGNRAGNAYTYTALNATSGLAAMQTPTPGSTLSGTTATFTWSSDANATAYWVDIGSTAGGNDIYSSGNLGNVFTTTVYTLPANGTIDLREPVLVCWRTMGEQPSHLHFGSVREGKRCWCTKVPRPTSKKEGPKVMQRLVAKQKARVKHP